MLKEIDILISQSMILIINYQIFVLIKIRIKANRAVTHFTHMK